MTQTKADLPEGSWAITKEDKKEIQKLGRELHKFFIQYAKTNAISGKFFPWKIVTGSMDYFQQLQSQKVKLVGDDILAVQDLVERYELGSFLEEPFTHVEAPTPEVPPVAENDSPSPAPAPVEETPVVEAPVEVEPTPTNESTPNTEETVQG